MEIKTSPLGCHYVEDSRYIADDAGFITFVPSHEYHGEDYLSSTGGYFEYDGKKIEHFEDLIDKENPLL
jgi:hypothetical protein